MADYITLFLFCIFLTFYLCNCQNVQHFSCKKTSSCSCMSDKGPIDLSPLDQKDGTFKYKAKPENVEQETFYFNPCTPFSLNQCDNVATCQLNGDNYIGIGKQDSAVFILDDTRGLTLQFKQKQDSGEKVSNIQLLCSTKEGEFTTTGETGAASGVYNMTLSSVHACPVSEKKKSNDGLSTGSILLILFFVLIIVYLVGGVVFNKFVRGATGTELIPNITFWSDFPNLVRDGVSFAVRGCKVEDSQYDAI